VLSAGQHALSLIAAELTRAFEPANQAGHGPAAAS
jgi:hypothetical protein